MNQERIDRAALNLDQMPAEELRVLAGHLMVHMPATADRDSVAAAVTRQLVILDGIEREALLDVVVWARRPVSRSAGKLELVREISQLRFVSYKGLSLRALAALAELRGLRVPDAVTDRMLRHLLYRSDGWSGWFARKRRALVGGMIGKLLDEDERDEEYQFLPERPVEPSLRRHIEQQGVMSGIATRLRSAADDYLNTKLDEIETRIDRKLDQIDQRLAEWRDQEIANRLRIIKITLTASIIIALISLVYTLIRTNL
ncbi:MAG: hypothetical protein GXY33_00470 [Phycisphaerae bacterium]|nr:hypothetical protein [Phycisphaerae bacterium]